MKILKSFDTKIDAEELVEAVNKYGEWNVILVKKHWVKLITPLLLVFLAMFMLDFLLYVIYEHLFDEHKVIFWILAIFYVYTTFSWCLYAIIWILTNIIWQIKAEKKYIDSTKLAKLKQASFEKFLKRSFITFVSHTLVLIFNAIVPFVVIETTWIGSIAVTVWALILDVLFLLTLNRVMYRIIDYEMNFNICTTDGFVSYNQDWFFRTNTKNISASAIKVIQASKDWLKWALWQYGNLYIHTDWDLNRVGWKILELSYIPDPKRLAKKINAMLEATRWNEWSISKIPVKNKEVISL